MRGFLSLFAVSLGIALFVGVDIFPLVGGILMLLIMAEAVFIMFGGPLPRFLTEIFLFILLGPIFVSSLIHLLIDLGRQMLISINISFNPVQIFLILLILMFLARWVDKLYVCQAKLI